MCVSMSISNAPLLVINSSMIGCKQTAVSVVVVVVAQKLFLLTLTLTPNQPSIHVSLAERYLNQ